jgi:hypothetical protein
MAIEFCGIDRTRTHRVHQWINSETLEPMFGVQANLAYGKWAHVVVPAAVQPAPNVPLLFKTRAEANAWIKIKP